MPNKYVPPKPSAYLCKSASKTLRTSSSVRAKTTAAKTLARCRYGK